MADSLGAKENGGTDMAIMVGRWERRDGAEMEALGSAALAYCQAVKTRPGVRGCRFFWLSPDRIVIQSEGDSAQVFDQPPDAGLAKALFALSDLARAVDSERWMDPRDGQAAYRTAGR
jgi:hypothetical protein